MGVLQVRGQQAGNRGQITLFHRKKLILIDSYGKMGPGSNLLGVTCGVTCLPGFLLNRPEAKAISGCWN